MMNGLLSTSQAPVRYRAGADVIKSRRILGPLRSRYPWVVCGLSIQVLGVGMAGAVMWRSIRRQSLGGHITAEMIKFAWRSELHTRVGLAMLVAGSVIYAAGSVVMARPYLSRPWVLFVAVPIAAVAGLLVLGVLALVLTVLFAVLENGDFGGDIGVPDRWRRKSRRGL
jgi:hypothetical protein